MGRKIRAAAGRQAVEVSGALADIESEIIDLVAPRIRREFESTAREVVRDARMSWPVRTGKSRDAFEVKTQLGPDYLEIEIRNDFRSPTGFAYPYAMKFSMWLRSEIRSRAKSEKHRKRLQGIHGKGTPNRLGSHTGKRPWMVLVSSPTKKQETPLARRLASDLNKLNR